MATKRSPSPAADMATDAPPAKELKTDHEADTSAADAPVDSPSLPTTSGGGAPPAETGAPAEAVAVQEDHKDEDEEPEEEPRPEGVKVSELKTIREMYEEGSLQGYDESEELAYPHDATLNEKVVLWRGDITKLEVDCIVNAANKALLGGGGVDGAIHSAAGPGLLAECRTLNGAETGETKLTGGHRLPVKHIAHTVGPVYSRGRREECEEKLRSCYKTTLDLCVENNIRTVAFSGISTGIYGYPLDAAAQVACDEIHKFFEGNGGDKIDKVIFCVFRQIDVNSYLDNIPIYFPPSPEKDSKAAADGADGANAGVEEKEAEDTPAQEDAAPVAAEEAK
ncbi:hypothetical protein JCM10450v2_001980 [Rhodotorula kratochvilovae]